MKRLKELRNEMKLTQQEVADALSIERITYARYESGARSPSLDMLSKLADFFNTTSDYLLRRTDGSAPVYKNAITEPRQEARQEPDPLPLITDIAARNTHGKEPITRDQVIEIVQEVLGDFRREQQRMNDIKRREDR